jgi:hypothetical protein
MPESEVFVTGFPSQKLFYASSDIKLIGLWLQQALSRAYNTIPQKIYDLLAMKYNSQVYKGGIGAYSGIPLFLLITPTMSLFTIMFIIIFV